MRRYHGGALAVCQRIEGDQAEPAAARQPVAQLQSIFLAAGEPVHGEHGRAAPGVVRRRDQDRDVRHPGDFDDDPGHSRDRSSRAPEKCAARSCYCRGERQAVKFDARPIPTSRQRHSALQYV